MRETAMTAMSKAVSLLAISAALILSGSHVFAKNDGPSQEKKSVTSAAPSGGYHGGCASKSYSGFKKIGCVQVKNPPTTIGKP
jgi:hypothetical protein